MKKEKIIKHDFKTICLKSTLTEKQKAKLFDKLVTAWLKDCDSAFIDGFLTAVLDYDEYKEI